MPKTPPPTRKPNNPPMSDAEMFQMEEARSKNRLHKGYNPDRAATVGYIADQVRNKISRISFTESHVKVLEDQIFRYLETCVKVSTVPTLQGVARSCGHTARSVNLFLSHHPEHPNAQFLETIKDALAEMLDQTSLLNQVNLIHAIFVLKTVYDRTEKSDIRVTVPYQTSLREAKTDEEIDAIRAKYLPPADD